MLMRQIGSFFVSAKRNDILQNEARKLNGTRLRTVKALSTTRWTSLAVTTDNFLTLLPAVVRALRVIAVPTGGFTEPSTRSEAQQILNSILHFEHILTAVVSLRES